MSWDAKTRKTLRRLATVQAKLKDLFTDRDLAVELLTLAVVCQEHLLLIGPPGTAKTELIYRFTEMIEAHGFHYLLTRFTEPSELFGPLDLKAFGEGTYHIRTGNMLPDAQIGFLDEVFQGSSAILNSLLTLVNERIFFNGSDRQRVPLICLIGASNNLPDDPGLRAFADRFPLRLLLTLVDDNHLGSLIGHGWELEAARIKAEHARLEFERAQADRSLADRRSPAPAVAREVQFDDLLHLNRQLLEVKVEAIRPAYTDVVRELRSEGVDLSDRRVVKGLKLVVGAALLREAEEADVVDFWPLNHFWSRPEEVESVHKVVGPRLAEAGGLRSEAGRPVGELVADLDWLLGQGPGVRTRVALEAHLMAFNRLRREVLKDHRENTDLRRRIEEAIQQAIGQLEDAHV